VRVAGCGLRVAGCALLVLAACQRTDPIATFKVEPTNFVRRVTAEGNLKAKNATPLSAPQEAPGPLKIAWIAGDGTLLKKNDVVVQFDPTEFETLLVGARSFFWPTWIPP